MRLTALASFLFLVVANTAAEEQEGGHGGGLRRGRGGVTSSAPDGEVTRRHLLDGAEHSNIFDSRSHSRGASDDVYTVIAHYVDDDAKALIVAAVAASDDGDVLVDTLDDARAVIVRVRFDCLQKLKAINGAAVTVDRPIESDDDSTIEPVSTEGARALQAARRRKMVETVPQGVTLIQADQLSTGTQKYVKICIADTGYAFHPDLPPYGPQVDGLDITAPSGDRLRWHISSGSTSHHTHGTLLAGIIGATPNNDMGLRGVLDSSVVHMFNTRGLGDDNKSTQAQMLEAVEQCVEAGADVVTVAMGCLDCRDEVVAEFFRSIYEDRGVLVVASSGNNGLDDGTYMYPASYPHVMSVAAVDAAGNRLADLSNANDAVEVAAHGEKVMSTYIDGNGGFGYAYMRGTSASTAYVAGAAALLWSHFPRCSNVQIRNALVTSARDNNSQAQCDPYTGYGVIKVRYAYNLLQSNGCDGGGQLLSGTAKTCDAPSSGQSNGVKATDPPTYTGGGCRDSRWPERVQHIDERQWSCKQIRSALQQARYYWGGRKAVRNEWCANGNSDAARLCPRLCRVCRVQK